MKLLLLCFLFTLRSLAQDLIPTATATAISLPPAYEAQVEVAPEENLEQVRQVLLAKVLNQIVIEELKIQNLNKDLFLKKIHEQIQKGSQTPFDESSLLLKSAEILTVALPSYIVQEEGVDQKNPKLRFIRVSGKKDTEAIRRLYFQTLRESGEFRFSSLLFFPQMELINCSYNDLFVSNQELLTGSLDKSWKKWFAENLSKNIGDFIVADSGLEAQVFAFMKENEDNSKANKEGEFSGALALRFKFRIEKTKENSLLGEREFVFHGEYALVDISSGLLISSGVVPDKKINFFIHAEKPAVELASALYRFPLADFLALSKRLDEFSQRPQLFTLEVRNIDSMMKLLSVSDLLVKQGVALQLKASLKKYDGQTGLLSLQIQGSHQTLIQTLKSLNKTVLPSGEVVQYKNENPFVLDFVKSGGK